MPDTFDLLVLSSAYTTDENRWRVFRESAKRYSVPLHVLGAGSNSYDMMTAIDNGLEFLHRSAATHVVITDAYDVIVNHWDGRRVGYIVDSAPGLILSVESNIWPPGPWEESYARLDPSTYYWRAICGGQMAGRRQMLIDLWEALRSRLAAGGATRGGTTQEILHQLFAAGQGVPITLDLECRLFQSMLGPHVDKIACCPHPDLPRWQAYNTVTRSVPMFLHFNGQGSPDGRTPPALFEWEERLRQ